MIPRLKAEFLKLFTVRATYIILGIALVITLFLAYFVEGSKGSLAASDATAIDQVLLAAFNLTGLFAALLALLHVSYEYRHRTILYTLASSPSRTQTLLAKIAVLVGFSIVLGVVIALLSVQAYEWALALKHAPLALQNTHWHELFARGVLYCGGYAFYGMVLAGILRNMAGAIACLLLIPSIVEVLLGFVLKDNANYLPFTALGQLMEAHGKISPGAAAIAVGFSIIIGFSLLWLTFMKRDAE